MDDRVPLVRTGWARSGRRVIGRLLAGALAILTGLEPGGAPAQVFDPLNHMTSYVTDYRWGRSTRVTDSNNVATDYEYDDAGRLKAVIRPGDSTGLPTMRYTYTFASGETPSFVKVERRELTHPAGYASTVHYADALGRPLHSAAEQVVDGVLATAIRGQTTYDAAGAVDESHRLATLTVSKLGLTHAALAYPDYSPRGFLEEIVDTRDPTGNLSAGATFTYDDLGRLLTLDRTATVMNPDEHFAYDALGNMRAYNGMTYAYQAAKPHQVAAVGGTPLACGRNGTLVTGRANQGYQFDPEDRLTQATASGGTVQFAYDAGGTKVKQDANGVATRYYTDLVEVTGSEMTKVYFFGGRRVASDEAGCWLLGC